MKQVERASISLGVGCSTRATFTDIHLLVRTMLDAMSLPLGAGDTSQRGERIFTLATLEEKYCQLAPVADRMGVPLVLFQKASLVGMPGVQTQSPRVLALTGISCVAEAAALAAIGPGATLLLARQTGSYCTGALAHKVEI